MKKEQKRCMICGRYIKDEENMTPRQKAFRAVTNQYHGHGETNHGYKTQESVVAFRTAITNTLEGVGRVKMMEGILDEGE